MNTKIVNIKRMMSKPRRAKSSDKRYGKNREVKKYRTTVLQKRAIDNILSGDYKSAHKAMIEAGYSQSAAKMPDFHLFSRAGTQVYLQQLEEEAQKKYGKSMVSKTIDVYMDGLSATKLYGKDAQEHPDYAVRKHYADKLTEFMGWKNDGQSPVGGGGQTQNNYFFMTPKNKQENFNKDFKKFMKKIISE